MNRKTIVSLFFALLVVGCSDGPAKTEVKPFQTSITGPLGRYLTIAEDDYQVQKGTEMLTDWLVQVRLTSHRPYEGDLSAIDPQISLEMTDMDGRPINGLRPLIVTDLDKLRKLLTSPAGTEESLQFSTSRITSDLKDLPEDVGGFRAHSTANPVQVATTPAE